jgi:hypothetical protein
LRERRELSCRRVVRCVAAPTDLGAELKPFALGDPAGGAAQYSLVPLECPQDMYVQIHIQLHVYMTQRWNTPSSRCEYPEYP